MKIKRKKQRKVYLIAAEGESERSFVRWIQDLCDNNGCHVHLDCIKLNGGGYEVMLNAAVDSSIRRGKNKTKPAEQILLVDADRGILGEDSWSQEKLRCEGLKKGYKVIFLDPNLEGVLVKMLKKNVTEIHPYEVENQLKQLWKDYQKPESRWSLKAKLSLDMLLITSKIDGELQSFLKMIGLYVPK